VFLIFIIAQHSGSQNCSSTEVFVSNNISHSELLSEQTLANVPSWKLLD